MHKKISQDRLAARFDAGATECHASNMSIREVEDGTEVIGYGHLVYAHRDRRNGHITLYVGWRTFSKTASVHLEKLRKYADEISDNKPTV